VPPPIVKIPVDDAAFKRFLDTFNKYQKELAAQPEMWKGMNEGMVNAALSGAAIAAEIAHQAEATKELAEAEAKRDKAMQKAADDAAKEAEKAKKRDEDAAKRRKDAIDQVKNYTKSLAEAAVSMGKWAAIDVGMGIGGAVLGGFGLKELGDWAGGQRKQAMGLGVSTSELIKSRLTLGRYISPESSLENLANLKSSAAGQTALGQMGITNAQNKSPTQLLMEAAEKAASAMNKYKGSPAQLDVVSDALGFGKVFGPDDLRALAAAQANKNELHKTIAKGNQTWATLGINDQTGQKWQDFSATIDAVGLKLKDHLADKLTVLAPNLEKVTDAFGNLIDTVLTKTNLDALSEGIGNFAKYIGSQDFKDDMATFAAGLSLMAGMMRKLFNNKELAAAGAGALAGGAAGTVFGGPIVGIGGAVLGGIGGALAIDMGDAPKTANTKTYQAMGRFWMAKGYSEAQARGIMANMVAENRGLDPFKWQEGVSHKKGGYGLFQESAERRDAYAQHFKHAMDDPHLTRIQAVAEQLEWYNIELNQMHPKVLKGKSVAQALKEQQDAMHAAVYDSLYGESAAGASGDRNKEALIRGTAATNAPRIKVDVALNVQPGTSAPHIANAVGYA